MAKQIKRYNKKKKTYDFQTWLKYAKNNFKPWGIPALKSAHWPSPAWGWAFVSSDAAELPLPKWGGASP